MNVHRWPPDSAISDLLTRDVQAAFIVWKDSEGKSHVTTSGMSEKEAMRVALRYLLGDD